MNSQLTTKYQTLLTNRFEALATSTGLNSECENVTSAITETAMKIAGQNKPQKPDKLSAETKQLREKRRQLKEVEQMYKTLNMWRPARP